MPSEKPVSSMRCAPMTRERRSCRPPARSSTAGRRAALQARPARGRGLRSPSAVRDPCLGRDKAADDALAIIGLEAVDAHVLGRQPVPDRQQQAGDDVEARCRRIPAPRRSRPPTARANCAAVGLAPMRAAKSSERRVVARPSAAPGGCARCTSPSSSIRLDAGTCTAARMRLLVDQQPCAGRLARASASARGRAGCGRGARPGSSASRRRSRHGYRPCAVRRRGSSRRVSVSTPRS